MKKYLYILSFCFLQYTLSGFAQNKQTSMSDTIKLPEATVLAERPFVQRKADRMIVSIEHRKLLKACSLSNILSLIPGVSYDGEGSVTIMGNGIRIYENGRMVKLSGTQLKRYLSSLRGNDIKSLEILLKQQLSMMRKEERVFLLSIGRRSMIMDFPVNGGSEYERKSKNSFSEFTGLTYSWGNFALYANMMLGRSESLSKIAESDYGRNITVNSISESTDKSLYYIPKLGFDFYISPKQYLGIEWSGNYAKDYANDCWVHSTITDNSPYPTSIKSYAPYTLRPNTNDVTLNYEWKTDTLGSKLNIIADYARKREHDLYEYENKYTLGISSDSIISKSQPSFERIDVYSAQVDFEKYFNHHQFTLGAKCVYAGIDYISKLYLGNTTLGGILSEEIDQRDDFNYFEQRYAIYGMYRYTSRSWGVQMGLRNEYTEWNTQQRVKTQLHKQ